MSRGRHTALTLTLTPAEVGLLTACTRATARQSAGLVRRARVVLYRHQGLSITAIARLVGLSRTHTYRWLKRYQEEGMAGLQNRRSGAPWKIKKPLQNQSDMVQSSNNKTHQGGARHTAKRAHHPTRDEAHVS